MDTEKGRRCLGYPEIDQRVSLQMRKGATLSGTSRLQGDTARSEFRRWVIQSFLLYGGLTLASLLYQSTKTSEGIEGCRHVCKSQS